MWFVPKYMFDFLCVIRVYIAGVGLIKKSVFFLTVSFSEIVVGPVRRVFIRDMLLAQGKLFFLRLVDGVIVWLCSFGRIGCNTTKS